MKKNARKARSAKPGGTLLTDFARGFVATGLLAAFQDRQRLDVGGTDGASDGRRILRHALQGGVALAAGSATAEALVQRDAVRGLIAITAGAATVLTLEQILRPVHNKSIQEI